MSTRSRLLGVLGLAVGTMMVSPAMAGYCALKSPSGACLFWVGSVSCENLNGTGVGNVTQDPKWLTCEVSPPDVAVVDAPTSVVFCANKGGSVPTGVNAYFSNEFSGFSQLEAGMVDRNGRFTGGMVHATEEELIADDSEYPDKGTEFQKACWRQNKNWYPVDYVPCSMNVTTAVIDADGLVVNDLSATYSCVLPNCENLGWDSAADRPQRWQYQCERVQ